MKHTVRTWYCLALSGLSTLLAPTFTARAQGIVADAFLGGDEACVISELKKSDTGGILTHSRDGRQFLVNKEDEEGIAQVYVGQAGRSDVVCITCADHPDGPKKNRSKMQVHWHPSGKWIFLAAEREKYARTPIIGWNRKYVEGQLQNGLWTNMYAVTPDGSRWYRMTDFRSGVKGVADGFTGPAFTPDGRQAVWSQIVSGNILAYWPFGKWELTLAGFEEHEGTPVFTNPKNITPTGMHWNEPGNFHPDNESLLFTGSDQKDAQGMDLHILNIRTGRLTNITKSPRVWDEHGIFSPDGKKIIFMSAHPYRRNPRSSKILTIRTEFMLMDGDGSNLVQLTHFRERGYPEYQDGIAASCEWAPDGRSVHLRTLFFPKYRYWDLVFRGPCGNQSSR